jgi:hypothetical protein
VLRCEKVASTATALHQRNETWMRLHDAATGLRRGWGRVTVFRLISRGRKDVGSVGANTEAWHIP